MPSAERRLREELLTSLAPCTDIDAVLRAADSLLRPAMRAEVAVWSTLDPATALNTRCVILADIGAGLVDVPNDAARERRMFELEWRGEDPNTFADLSRRGVAAAGLRRTAAAESVARFRELLAPAGIHDELRVVCQLDDLAWGTVVLLRLRPAPFDAGDEARAAAWAPVLARELRRVMLRSICDASWLPEPPGVVQLDAAGAVTACSRAALALIGDLDAPAVRTAFANLAACVAGDDATTLSLELPGGPIRLHASADTRASTLSIVVERPRRAELAPMILRALGLTPREREITELLLRGLSRKQIADRLGVRDDSVGEHLTAIYRKTGVDGRPELIARVFGDYYTTRRDAGAGPSPYGFFAPDENVTRR